MLEMPIVVGKREGKVVGYMASLLKHISSGRIAERGITRGGGRDR
jgi:hypothetical protein